MSFIFYLMSNYSWRPDKNTAVAISRYLEKLSDHPGCDPVLLSKVVKQLASQWQQIHESNHGTGIFINSENIHT